MDDILDYDGDLDEWKEDVYTGIKEFSNTYINILRVKALILNRLVLQRSTQEE